MKSPKKSVFEAIVFLLILSLGLGFMGSKMGVANMLNTMMKTAHDLLLTTVFFIMGITVMMGALSKLLTEFGVISLLERVLRPIMKPIFNLPGIAALGAVVTFFSDNPAIIALSKDRKFASYFKIYQMISLTNFGTAFGMGLVVVMFMMSLGFITEPLVGFFGAVCGCVISTRLMQRFTLKAYPEYVANCELQEEQQAETSSKKEVEQDDSFFMRFLNAMLDGGKTGVELGMAIIPGVLVISTIVMMITFDTTEFTGEAYQGIGLLPWLCDKIDFIFEWAWGFTNSKLIAFPVTALGAVGAAIGLVPTFNTQGILDSNAVVVFTAIGMCWSGYLSTHAAMLDSLGYRKLISKAILAHTIAGICAGIIAHWTWVLIS